MKTVNSISDRRGKASFSSFNRISRKVLLWAVGIIGGIVGLALWAVIRPVIRGAGWIISLLTAMAVAYWLLTL